MKSGAEEGPDRGWSWVIAFACFSITLILIGIYRTSGILMVAFVNEYEVSREASSWPLFLCFSIVDLTGLIVGPLGQKFGVRTVTIAGSLISTLGVSLCFFAHSLDYITVPFGVIFGFGFGLAYTLLPVIINEYFLKHRATANGIAYSGGCFGSVLFPPLYEHLMSTYGLNGCLLLTGGIILQLAISGSLMKPPSWLKKLNSGNTISNSVEKSDCLYNSPTNKSSSCPNVVIIKQDVITVSETSNQSASNKNIQYDKTLTQDNLNPEIISIINNPLLSDGHREYDEDQIELSLKNSCKLEDADTLKVSYSKLSKYPFGATYTAVNDADDKMYTQISKELQNEVLLTEIKSLQNLNINQDEISECLESDNLIQDDNAVIVLSDVSSEVKEKPVQISKLIQKNLSSDKTYGDESCTSDVPLMQCEKIICNQIEDPKIESKQRPQQNVQKTDKDCNVSILQSFKTVLSCPMFYVIAISHVIFYSNEEMFYVIYADFYLDKGVADEDVKYIIIAFSVCGLIGLLCFGWVTDRKILKSSHFTVLCMVAIAAVYISFPFANGYVSLIILNSLYGLILGCTTTVFCVLPADYLQMDIQAVAFGCIGFLSGILTLMFSLLIGYFRDYLGSYSNIFYLMGAVSVVTSFLWLLENCFAKTSNLPVDSELS